MLLIYIGGDMTYIVTENSLTFVANGKTYFVLNSSEEYSKLKKALESGCDEEKALNIYNERFVRDAKKLLEKVGKNNGAG